jgi:hypothetical protein
MYGEVLSAASPAALLGSVLKSLVHPVMADPWSIAPKTSQVGAKTDVLVQLKLQRGKLSDLKIARQDEQTLLLGQLFGSTQHRSLLPAELAAIIIIVDKKIANCRYDAEDEETKLVWKAIAEDTWEKIEDPTVTITLPNTPMRECLLSARHTLVDNQEQLKKNDEAEIKLARDIAALRAELPHWRRLLFFFSGNGRLLNQFRFACFLAIALALSSLLLYLSSGGSTADPAGSEIIDDDDGVGSVYGMLQRHCDRVPANSDGAYFDFWTIWVLITAYCAVSALFVSRVLLHDLAQELLERAAGCIRFICCCRKTTTTQPAGWLLLLCHRNV